MDMSKPSTTSPKASTTFKLFPEDQLPSIFRTLSCSQPPESYPSSKQTDVSGLPEAFLSYYESLQRSPSVMALSPASNLQSLDSVLEQFKEVLEEKMLLARLLLRIQQTYEERELLLRRYLSEEAIERLICERSLAKSTATVGSKYLDAIVKHNLRSFAANFCNA